MFSKPRKLGPLHPYWSVSPLAEATDNCFNLYRNRAHVSPPLKPGNSHFRGFPVKVRIEGEWIQPAATGEMTRSQGMRRFQGIGKTTREGRMNAAEAALKRLRDLMPGLEFSAGVVPKKWER